MRYVFPQFTFATVVAFVLVIAFGRSELRAANPQPPVAQPAKPLPLTEKDYLEFGRKLEEAAIKGDKATIDKLVRIVDLFERSLNELKMPEKDRKAFLAGAQKQSSLFAEQIIAAVKKGGRYSLLRTREVDGRQRVLMRLIFEDSSLNYHDFLLVRSPNGQVVTEDVYVFLSGEMLSHTLRRLLLSLLPDLEQGLAIPLKGSDQLYLKNLSDVTKMTTAVRDGRGKEALAIYRKLPTELQKEKSLQLMAIMAAQNTDEDEYLMELERFRKAYPKDAAIDFLSIDFYILKKQYDAALKAIDQVDKSVGGDPYLQIIKGGVLNQAGKNAQAKAIIEKGIQDDPKLILGYWERVGIALEEKNHADTLAWLKKIEESGLAKIDLDSIKTSESYAEFFKSPEFGKLKAWLAERKQ